MLIFECLFHKQQFSLERFTLAIAHAIEDYGAMRVGFVFFFQSFLCLKVSTGDSLGGDSLERVFLFAFEDSQ